jgi:hypothetical protein
MWTAGHEVWGPPSIGIGALCGLASAYFFLSPALRKYFSIQWGNAQQKPKILIPGERHLEHKAKEKTILVLPRVGTKAIWTFLGSLLLIASLSVYFYRNFFIPNVTIQFFNPKHPSLLFNNISLVTAKDVFVTAIFWDADDPENKIFPVIFRAPMGFIRPSSGRQVLCEFFSNYSELLKNGHELVGSVGVVCPDCIAHTIIFGITWGEGGWYVDLPMAKNGQILLPPKNANPEELRRFIQLIRALPSVKDTNHQLKPITEYDDSIKPYH